MSVATSRHRPGAALISACIVIALGAAPLAHAEAVGTVRARTQRSAAPDLASQEGTYDVGNTLVLVCSTHGQPVTGHATSSAPGAWDDLWYRTSDGHYVPDADIETAAPNQVTQDCGVLNSAGPQADSREDRAIAWANAHVGSDDYPFACGQFVANAYGRPNLGAISALAFHDQLAQAGQIHLDGDIPKGALVFSHSVWDTVDGVSYGHVVIARGDGTYVSGGMTASNGVSHTVQILSSWNPSDGAQYLGWATAPANWPGA